MKKGTWNINGLAPNKQELETLIKINKLDVILVSESHLTERSVFRLTGFSIYCTNHPDGTAHGGTAILIKKSIKHHVLPEVKTEGIQATSISVSDWLGQLTLTSIYCPPKHKLEESTYTQFLQALGPRLWR